MKLKLIPDPLVFFTDGSCQPNPGRGGWAVMKPVGVVDGVETFDSVAGGYDLFTTNIKMEGMAIGEAMRLANDAEVHIYTDSKFWIDVLTQYAQQWYERDWTRKGGEIKNLAMVKELFFLHAEGNVRLHHVRGHQGIPGNEAADAYADQMRLEGIEHRNRLAEREWHEQDLRAERQSKRVRPGGGTKSRAAV